MDDELLQEFVNESREHLATIETDLLSIEAAGENVGADLLNKVFRAAHSIKGGSSFFGLTKVKDLAHRAETVLDMMRSRTITPNAEVTNLLLAAFDMLRVMVNNTAESEEVETDDMLSSLSDLASASLAPAQRPSLRRTVVFRASAERAPVVIPEMDFQRLQRENLCVYQVDYDLIHDIEEKGLNVLKLFREIRECGEIIDCEIDFDAVGTLDGNLGNNLPLRLIFGTSLGRDHISDLLSAPESKISLLFDPYNKGIQIEYGAFSEARYDESEAQLPATVSSNSHHNPAPPPPVPAIQESDYASVPEAPLNPSPEGSGKVATPSATSSGGTVDETLRISVNLLDSLMNLAGELVLSRNQLGSAISTGDPRALAVANQRVSYVTSELQEAIMRTRLQPIGNVFSKFPRVVRDLAKSLGKEVNLDIKGESVALDRSLAEGLSDPLTHMVRNAVDHGVELPADRISKGKRPAGTLRIEARHEAGQMLIEIADDGGGIKPDRVAESAIKKGLIAAEKVANMTEAEKIHLIFLPGLSTAAQVTHVSGRGVGMDVVKTNLDRLGGKIAIKSVVGQGSIFTIKLPLTLAIIPALIVSNRSEFFAIPQVNIVELIRVEAKEIGSRTSLVGKAPVLMLRDLVIPLVYLSNALGMNESFSVSANSCASLEIVVVSNGAQLYALVVGTFHQTEEIVVKPLGMHLKALREYAGATVLGTGTVALILDIAGLAVLSGLGSSGEAADSDTETTDGTQGSEIRSLLTFENVPGERCAVPLDAVVRVERIAATQIETIAGRRSMQYNERSLPLVALADSAQVSAIDYSQELVVLVVGMQEREIGILGTLPVDAIETDAVLDEHTHRQKGLAGSAIINNVTTLVVDLPGLLSNIINGYAVAPLLADTIEQSTVPVPSHPRLALVVEDSDFFRAQVKKYLAAEGIEAIEARDGESALTLLNNRPWDVGIVITDIEMPGITGLELTRRIRSQERFANLPIIALSALVGEEDLERGREAGLTDYQVKLDRDALIESVERLLDNPDAGDRPFHAAGVGNLVYNE